MKTTDHKAAIVELLGQHTRDPLAPGEIAEQLKLRGHERKQLSKLLAELAREGAIVAIRQGRYALGREADLVTGELQAVRSGNGYVAVPAGASVFVPSEQMGTALPGDRVVVRLERDPARDRIAGRVIQILERARRDIVGTLRATERFLHVVPLDPSYHKDFYVPAAAGAQPGDRVVVRFTAWANRHVNPEGEIVDVIGPADHPGTDTVAVIRHHGLRDEFPAEALREAERASALVDRPGPRDDLRALRVITIDPERARDFDDALSLERDPQGRRVLGVHIADVSHFVRKAGALDEEARLRGNSVYFPDRVLPMLPEQLSNGVCSLRPDEDRLAFTAFLTFDHEGEVVQRAFARTRIRSCRRFTYEEAYAVLRPRQAKAAGPARASDEPARALLRELDTLAQQLRARRYAAYALALDVPECEIVLDAEGRMTDLRTVPNDESHQLVEECMVAANEAVAAELSQRGLPQIARLHEPPDEDKIGELTAELESLGYHPGNLNHRKALADLLRSVAGDALEHHVRVAVLRSMKRALYSAAAHGHFGLAKDHYSHFTSPIRRYADLTLHRQLAAAIARARPAYARAELDPIAAHISLTEYTSERAERDVEEIKKYRFLADQVEAQNPRSYTAAVTRVVNFGMFVEVGDLQLSGMVHISAIPGRFVRFNRSAQTLQSGSRRYKLGDRLKVYPLRVDIDARRIDFGLAGKDATAG
jgi:ribonuclease R